VSYHRGMRPGWLLVCALAAGACGGDNVTPTDAPPGPDGGGIDAPQFDARITFDNLIDTGLCLDPACDQIAPGVLAYTPRSELWSDTAAKRRWILLPAGTQIDTSDMDYWQFPIGTKIWKEFERDGTRVETRLIQKVGPMSDDWFFAPYIWNAAQDSAVATPQGQDNANGTMHDVPTRAECKQCHDRQEGDVLGFAAIQLDVDATAGEIDLDDLIAMNLLSDPPGGSLPHFPLPGSAAETDALGYMHANCGHCHNPTSDVFRDITDIDLRMQVGLLASVDVTPTWTSTINVTAVPPVDGAMLRVHPQDLDDSVLYRRFISVNQSVHMPKLGAEITDPAGQAIIETWINGLPP
jgi:hypothetical protein